MPTFDNALILHDLPIMQSSYQYNNAFKYQNPKIQIKRKLNRTQIQIQIQIKKQIQIQIIQYELVW